jgi:hypothetical protein
MPSSKNIPQNAEEAGLIAFALVDALIETLVSSKAFDPRTADLIFRQAASALDSSPQIGSSRAADFLRRTRLDDPGKK